MADIVPISGYNDRVQLNKVLPLDTPFTLNVFPVNYCNFRCSFCAQSLGTQGLKEEYNYDVKEKMELSTFENIAKKSKEFKNPYKLLSFMGHGEPLLHKDLPKMIEIAKKNAIADRIEIITNGSLLTKNLSDELIDAGINNIRISLEGMSSQAYKDICGANIDFNAFLDNIAYFHEKGARTGSKIFVKVIDCCLKEGEDKLFYETFDKISSRMYIEQVKPVYSGVDIKSDENATVLTDRYGNEHTPRLVCPLAFFSLSIWPNGDTAPCDAIYKPISLGNVNSDSLKDMFSGSKANSFRVKLLKGEKNSLYGCSKCCAPDDVSCEQDELDSEKERLLTLYNGLL